MELEKAKNIHYKGINKAFCYFTQQEAKGKDIVVYGSGFGDVPSAVVATDLKNAAKKADEFAGTSYKDEISFEELKKIANNVTMAVYG